MEWTLSNLIIQIVAGFLGAHAAATAAHEHKFGLIGHSIVGLIGGALSGYFLQVMLMTTVTGSGGVMTPKVADVFMIQALAGAVVGGICMFAVGFAMRHRSSTGDH